MQHWFANRIKKSDLSETRLLGVIQRYWSSLRSSDFDVLFFFSLSFSLVPLQHQGATHKESASVISSHKTSAFLPSFYPFSWNTPWNTWNYCGSSYPSFCPTFIEHHFYVVTSPAVRPLDRIGPHVRIIFIMLLEWNWVNCIKLMISFNL